MLRAPADGFVVGGGDSGHPVGEGDDPLGDRAAMGFVLVELPGGECLAEGVPVLDAGVHALTAGRAVHVGGVAGQQQAAGPVVVGDPVMDPEPGGPGQPGDLGQPGCALVQQPLHEGEIGRGRASSTVATIR